MYQHTHQLPQELLLVEFSCAHLNEPQTEKFSYRKYSQLHVVLVYNHDYGSSINCVSDFV